MFILCDHYVMQSRFSQSHKVVVNQNEQKTQIFLEGYKWILIHTCHMLVHNLQKGGRELINFSSQHFGLFNNYYFLLSSPSMHIFWNIATGILRSLSDCKPAEIVCISCMHISYIGDKKYIHWKLDIIVETYRSPCIHTNDQINDSYNR